MYANCQRRQHRFHSDLSLGSVSETQPVTVTVFNVEIAITIGLIAEFSCDLHSFGLKFAAQVVGIVDPDVGVPSVASWIS
jgi:hypothetical protein